MKKLFFLAVIMLFTQISRAQWEDDVLLSGTPDTSYVFYGMTHTLAAKGDTVHVVWYDKSDGRWDILYKRSTDGGLNWGPNQVLTGTIDETGSRGSSIAVSGPYVYIYWWDKDNFEIYGTRSEDRGETWGEIVRFTNDITYSYEVVIATSGPYVHVAWVDVDLENNYYKILYRNSPDGGLTWTDEQWLAGSIFYSYNPSIAADGPDVYIVWNDKRDSNLEIYYIKSADNGSTWGPETRLTNDPATSHMPSVAVSGSTVHITWQDWREGDPKIYYKGSVDGGSNWSEDKRIGPDWASSMIPNLAVSNSVLHVVWMDYRNYVYDIFYCYSTDAGETWAADTQLNDVSFVSERPAIAVSDSILHVVWHDYRDFNYEIYYKRNPTGGVPVTVDENTENTLPIIYPNPASRLLTVAQSAVGSRQSAVRLSIIDLFGRELKKIGDISSFPCQVDISDLPDGVYILRLTDDLGNEEAVKFVKQANSR